MKKASRKRFLSLIMIVAFLGTMSVALTLSSYTTDNFHSESSIQTQSEVPCGSGQQLPFEEKEKEFEDKGLSAASLFVIYELEYFSHRTSQNFSAILPETNVQRLQVPLFLSYHTFLI